MGGGGGGGGNSHIFFFLDISSFIGAVYILIHIQWPTPQLEYCLYLVVNSNI